MTTFKVNNKKNRPDTEKWSFSLPASFSSVKLPEENK